MIWDSLVAGSETGTTTKRAAASGDMTKVVMHTIPSFTSATERARRERGRMKRNARAEETNVSQ